MKFSLDTVGYGGSFTDQNTGQRKGPLPVAFKPRRLSPGSGNVRPRKRAHTHRSSPGVYLLGNARPTSAQRATGSSRAVP
jgi:hypothetical protein